MKSLVIVDYGSGNLHSVQQSVSRVANELKEEWSIKTSSKPKEVLKSDYIILPGVGNFADCRQSLAEIQDMEQVLQTRVQEQAAPFLGICVGMQLMATKGFEGNLVLGLDWINGSVLPLSPKPKVEYKIPHMGWNKVSICNSNHSLSSKLANDLFYYFVHSYHFYTKFGWDPLCTIEHPFSEANLIELLFSLTLHDYCHLKVVDT